jgi:hypothetical protein
LQSADSSLQTSLFSSSRSFHQQNFRKIGHTKGDPWYDEVAEKSATKSFDVLPTKAIMADSPRNISLFCYILGVSLNPFSVQVQDDDTVDGLKRTILKALPNTFAQIDFAQLTVWKVCRVSIH